MKIAHECPLSIFEKVQSVTDYDYALVHLFEENKNYYNKFVEAKAKGREIILDNSIFELDIAFDAKKYVKWIEKLEPTWYIIPDVLNHGRDTIDSFYKFVNEYRDLPGKAIAVAQGNLFDDLVWCYNHLSSHYRVDKIGISFDYPWMIDCESYNKYHGMMIGRQRLINKLLDADIIKKQIPHHLLGCGLPQEFKEYREYEWIDSIDTSNPVIHGMKGIRYTEDGLTDKESVKLFTLIEENVLDKWSDVEYNIKMFRSFCKG